MDNFKAQTDLNEAQAQAALTLSGAVLILAGAGTGKTKTLTARIALLLEQKRAFPSQVLALTFTNKAAGEMRMRVLKQAGVDAMPWLGTFHSIAAKMLRMMLQESDFGLGLTSDFTIIDTSDQKRVIKELLRIRNIDEKKTPPNLLLHFISRWKDSALMPENVKKNKDDDVANLAASIWTDYQHRLSRLNAVDFGDLINLCVLIFRKHPEILLRWQEKFKFILVDEYQDTNHVQHILLKLLAGEKQNICCVGDDDQSIYGWRGAEVKNILEFGKTFHDPKIVRLEQNYRSTKFILRAADSLIAHNKARLGKKLWTALEDGNKIAVWESWDGKEEAEKICAKILEAKAQGISLASIAILVRTSSQMRLFEEKAIANAIPYRIVGSLRFYERAEIRDANAYLRLIVQIKDDLAFRRIINQPKRQLGKTTIDALTACANVHNCSLFEAAQLDEQKLLAAKIRPSAIAVLKSFVKMIESLQARLDTASPDMLTDDMLNSSGLRAMWRALKDAAKDISGQTQLDNLNELCRAIGDFSSIREYLEHIALVMENEEGEQNAAHIDRVNMMTLHAAKGLEFDNVFLPGWEEGLFPHQRSLDEPNGIEEERRLAYVGLTRARETAVVSFVRARLMFNEWLNCEPSRFIHEMGQGNVIIHAQTAEAAPAAAAAAAAVYVTEEPTRIHHEIFGEGSITSSRGDNLSILFDSGTRKMIKSNFVRYI